MAIVVEIVQDEVVTTPPETVAGDTKLVEIVRGTTSPIETTQAESLVAVSREGGTVANAQWGYGFPETPYEGMIWINVTE